MIKDIQILLLFFWKERYFITNLIIIILLITLKINVSDKLGTQLYVLTEIEKHLDESKIESKLNKIIKGESDLLEEVSNINSGLINERLYH